MIKKISLSNIASYKNLVSLETDKKFNFIYGLNGTGKTILSSFLYNKDNPDYSNCSIEGVTDEELLVYNQKFINDFFYEHDNLKGIFTLSKKNKESEEEIEKSKKERSELNKKKEAKINNISDEEENISTKKKNAKNKIWKIKTQYSGGDRVLEFCLDGLKSSKDKLFEHILEIPETAQPSETVEAVKKSVQALQGDDAQKHASVPILDLTMCQKIETNNIFQKEIIGNENSTVAELIKKLNNSDWIKTGLGYLPDKFDENGEPCPFCQQNTITEALASDIRGYFGEAYEIDVNILKKLLLDYKAEIDSIPSMETYKNSPFVQDEITEFENKHNPMLELLKENKRKIEAKIKTPSQKISIENSSETIQIFSELINDINKKIEEHNKKLDNKQQELKQLKETFWNIMRWDYDQTISSYSNDKSLINKKIAVLNEELKKISNKIEEKNKVIIEQQKNTINIKEAINNINGGLANLGMDGFTIEEYESKDNFYKIVRASGEGESETEIFKTLSEGEKMIISFLYFIELCKGKTNPSEDEKKKIIVIDDPISSLSHIYIFNIGQLIKTEFLRSNNYEQVFLLTHSLYFFYELIGTNLKMIKKNQKMFRLVKKSEGSDFLDMKYNEIQNDYHSYWQIINDKECPPVLIANCMRNIIEHFFGFIEKNILSDVFKNPVFKNNKYQAFYRYIHRESHSDPYNIFDIKEFNYEDFKKIFKYVFTEAGYKEHYDKMIKPNENINENDKIK